MTAFDPDPSRCVSTHWSLPVQCVLKRTHRENWHESWHPESGNRIRYRATVQLTQESRDGEWHDLASESPCLTEDKIGSIRRQFGERPIIAELLKEVDRLTAENRRLTRSLNDTMDDRERAQTMADRLAYAIAPVETIGEHSDMNDPWDNACEELHRQRQELADTAMMRDFNGRSAEHIAAKRNLAEAAIASWDRGEIDGDAAVLMIRKALADGPVTTSCHCGGGTVHQQGCEGGE